MPKILPIVVLYNKKFQCCETYRSLLHGLDCVIFIYDNSQTKQLQDWEIQDNWIYVHDSQNSGVSKAYNVGYEYAVSHNYDWILLLDQDTTFEQNSFSKLEIFASKLHSNLLLIPQVYTYSNKLLSPRPLFKYFVLPHAHDPKENIQISKYAIINTGLCVSTKVFGAVGGYNENVFLDFSDMQFIEKLSVTFPDGYVLPIKCHQNFSNISDSESDKLTRFRLFCKSGKSFKCIHHSRMWFNLVVVKRALMLCIKTKTLTPIKVLKEEYL